MFILVGCSIKNDATSIDEQRATNYSHAESLISLDTLNPKAFPDSLHYFVKQANILVALYDAINSAKDSAKVLEFYEAFPSDFWTFELIYGNKTMAQGLPLLLGDRSEDHIKLFFNAANIDEKIVIVKSIAITQNAKWDADGVNYFKHNLNEFVKNNTKKTFDYLSTNDELVIRNFFSFLFSGPHRPTSLPEEFIRYKNDYFAIYKIAESEL